MKDGVSWICVSNAVAQVEGVCALLQEAGNTTAQLSKGESEFQLLLRIQTLCAVQKTVPKWAGVKQILLRSKPQSADAAPFIFAFLTRFGKKTLMDEVEGRLKAQSSLQKTLGAEFYKSLGHETPECKRELLTVMRHCILALAYCSEKKITHQDVRKIYGKDTRAEVLAGQACILQMRKLLKDNGVARKDVQQTMHKFEDTIVLLSLGKVVELDKDAACLRCVDEIEKALKLRISAAFDSARPRLEACEKVKRTASSPRAPNKFCGCM